VRIGFDAKYYFDPPSSGRVWTRQVLQRLAPDHGHQWTWLLKRADRERAGALPGGQEVVFRSAGWNLLSNTLVLPGLTSRCRLDALVTQYFAAPTRTPQITVVHDIIFEPHPEFFTRRERLYLGCIKPLLRLADTVVTVSEASRQDLQRYGYLRPGQSCAVIPNGVDDRFFEPVSDDRRHEVRRKFALPDRFLLYVGRLNARKNLDRLIESFSQMRDRSVTLVLAGRTDGAADDYPELAESRGVADRVRFLGSVPDDDLQPLYSLATLFVYLSKREGFGLPPLEALATGVPVVASDEVALREVCAGAATYVIPDDTAAVAAVLDRLLDDTDARDRQAAMGRARAREFTWDRTAAGLVAALDALPRRQ